MHTLVLVAILLQSPQTIGPTETYPVKDVSSATARHLLEEILKGKDNDDFGRMLLLWSKITSGTISEPEVAILKGIADRPASRARGLFKIDEVLYKTQFAGQLLALYDNKLEQDRKQKEQQIANERAILELQKQIDDLRKQIEELTKKKAQ